MFVLYLFLIFSGMRRYSSSKETNGSACGQFWVKPSCWLGLPYTGDFSWAWGLGTRDRSTVARKASLFTLSVSCPLVGGPSETSACGAKLHVTWLFCLLQEACSPTCVFSSLTSSGSGPLPPPPDSWKLLHRGGHPVSALCQGLV